MFDLKRPCVNCPFRKGQGPLFQLPRRRLLEILNGVAFQCHKTVEYSDSDEHSQGDKPQQCAGLMALLHREGRPNQIMQTAQRLIGYDPGVIDAQDVYASINAAIKAHTP